MYSINLLARVEEKKNLRHLQNETAVGRLKILPFPNSKYICIATPLSTFIAYIFVLFFLIFLKGVCVCVEGGGGVKL